MHVLLGSSEQYSSEYQRMFIRMLKTIAEKSNFADFLKNKKKERKEEIL